VAGYPGGAGGLSACAGAVQWRCSSSVITGLDLVIPLRSAILCLSKRDGRDKPGHDKMKPLLTSATCSNAAPRGVGFEGT
jgi:hypothetical protein